MIFSIFGFVLGSFKDQRKFIKQIYFRLVFVTAPCLFLKCHKFFYKGLLLIL